MSTAIDGRLENLSVIEDLCNQLRIGFGLQQEGSQ